MTERLNLLKQPFGHLLVIEDAGASSSGNSLWKCQCDCGNEVVVLGTNLRKGNTKSCGCTRKENLKKANIKRTKHGMFGTPLYCAWNNMKQRCFNTNSVLYKNYGGRGITVCEAWRDFVAFRDWALSSGYEEGLTIDRIDNNGDYTPENCRWTTYKEQLNNTRRTSMVKFEGKMCRVLDLAEEYNIPREILRDRLNKSNWSIEKSLAVPYKGRPLKHEE